MPVPIPGQSQDDFLQICIPQVLQDGTAETPEQAVAVCISMYEQAKKDIKEQTNGISS